MALALKEKFHNMSSLVEELQKDSLNHDIKIIELLQKSLVVSTKLRLDEFACWVRQELDGYGETDIPKYRELHGEVQVFNPYHGYQPLEFQNLDQAKRFSVMHFDTPIGELEHNIKGATKSGSDSFHASFSPKTEKMLMNAINYKLQPSLRLNASQFQGILDAVRKIILEWSLKLEQDGILGENMSFSQEEKTIAKGDTYTIKNYIKGNISDSQIQLEASNSSQTKTVEFDINKITNLISALQGTIDAIGIDNTGKQELNADLGTLEAQVSSPKPNNTIIGESLSSIKRTLEAASGNIIASGLLNQMGTLFGV